MSGYLFVGLMCLLLRLPKVMFTCFAACAMLCMALKYSADTDLKHAARTDGEVIKIAQFNVADFSDGYEKTISEILSTNADFISIQEVTPDWGDSLKIGLQKSYPYKKIISHSGLYGLAVFSKYELSNLDISYGVENIPNIIGSINIDKQPIYFISSYISRPFYSKDMDMLSKRLQEIGDNARAINEINAPIFTLGDFNAPPWWDEIQRFQDYSGLEDSRRSCSHGLLDTPEDYIFYSGHFKCVDFQTVSSVSTRHLGIQGTYQFNTNPDAPKNIKTSQIF